MRDHVFIIMLLVFLITTASICNAQDTLYYQNGNIEIGKILEVDSIKGKIAFKRNDGSTKVMLFSSLKTIGLNGIIIPDNNFFSVNSGGIHIDSGTKQSNDLSEWRTKYSPWMIQVDALSPFFDAPSPFLNSSNAYPYNSSIGVGVEYYVTDRLGLSAMSRVGTGKMSFSSDTIRDLYFFKVPFIPELLFEVTLSSRIYPGYQRVFSPYLAPFVSFGSLRYYHRQEFFRYEDENAELPDALYSLLLVKRAEGYFQVGATLGFILNFTKSINLSAQLNIVSTNATPRSGEHFEARGNPVIERIHSDYDKPRQINMNGQIFLAYRIGNSQ